MNLDRVAHGVISSAYNEAKINKHEYLTCEHILYAALFFDEVVEILEGCGGDIKSLKKDLNKFFLENMTFSETEQPMESIAFYNVMKNIEVHAISAQQEIIRIGDILATLYDEKDSFAVYFLKKQGIERFDILDYISQIDYDEDYDDEDYEEVDILEKYTINLSEKAENNELDPLIGREEIIRRTLQILGRRTKNNPIHVGDPGVGKTAIVNGLANMMAEGNVPMNIKDHKVYLLDMGSILAGTKYRGDFEDRLKKIFKKFEGEKAIVYIDEIHNIVGAGSTTDGAMDASNILKPFLASGKIRCIGSTTYDEYKKFFDKDRALSRRFQMIEIPETSVEETYKILIGLKEHYESFHNVSYTDEALKTAVDLSAKYINDRFLPDKAIDVIDESGSLVRLENQNDEKILIDHFMIEKTVASMAKIPEKTVSEDDIDQLKNLENRIKSELFGQDQAVNDLVRAVKRSRAGFNEGQKPVASLLFVGPTGVGKTELAKQVSKHLNIPLIRFDMSEYQEKHTIAKLIGAPPGYVGYGEGGELVDQIRKHPYSVLLLDEIEKAHEDIFNLLLQVMDYATLTDKSGRKADFRNVVIIMTSNAGAREVGKAVLGFGDRQIDQQNIDKAVEKAFSPEFRNRLNASIVFKHIDTAMADKIARKAVESFTLMLKEKNIELTVSEAAYKWIAEKGFSSKFGAREIIRVVENDIKTDFVDKVLFGNLANGGKASIDIKDGKITIEAV